MTVIVSLDIGTSSICAMATRAPDMRPLALRSVPNDADVNGLKAGRHEQDPVRALERCRSVMRDLLADEAVEAGDVAGIGVSGQMHGVLLIDEDSKPLTNLITWRDQRTADPGQRGCLSEIVRDLPEDLARRVGCGLHPGYGGATLRWLAMNGLAPSGARALSMADFVAADLTGIAATEPTHAASWGLLNLESGTWDADVIGLLAIPEELLPTIHPSARPLRAILPERARVFGIPDTTQVCSPVGDNQASFIGAAGLDGDAMVVNLGTGGQVSIPRKELAFARGMETRPMPFGGCLLVGASLCGGWSYAHLRRFYQAVAREIGAVEVSDEQAYARMNALAASAHETAGGLTADTRFSGTRGDPSLRGAVSGIGADNLTPGNLARAILEGMARELRDMAFAAGLEDAREIVAGGNAARMNPLLLDIIERQFGLPCRLGNAREEAAAGAALAAARGLGLLGAGDRG